MCVSCTIGERLAATVADPRCKKSGVYWSWNGNAKQVNFRKQPQSYISSACKKHPESLQAVKIVAIYAQAVRFVTIYALCRFGLLA